MPAAHFGGPGTDGAVVPTSLKTCKIVPEIFHVDRFSPDLHLSSQPFESHMQTRHRAVFWLLQHPENTFGGNIVKCVSPLRCLSSLSPVPPDGGWARGAPQGSMAHRSDTLKIRAFRGNRSKPFGKPAPLRASRGEGRSLSSCAAACGCGLVSGSASSSTPCQTSSRSACTSSCARRSMPCSSFRAPPGGSLRRAAAAA